MKVAVWGIGAVGAGIACRLATMPFVSELFLVNRSYEVAFARAIDIGHGLAFAPSCWTVRAVPEERVQERLGEFDLLVLTQGTGVKKGATRADLYPANRDIFRRNVLPALAGFEGVVLVVSNPVDLMARLLVVEGRLPTDRVMGLGTVVETARLRAALASNAIPARAAHDVWAYVVGSHDDACVCAQATHIGPSLMVSPDDLATARDEVIQGARRVRESVSDEAKKFGTLHPIVEGAVAVVGAIATDARRTLTVSVEDPDTSDRVFYSLPCTLGRGGILERHAHLLEEPQTRAGIQRTIEQLRATLAAAP